MSWEQLISELGGGLSSVVIVGLAFWGWNRDREVTRQSDLRIQDLHKANKEHQDLAREFARSLDAAVDSLRNGRG